MNFLYIIITKIVPDDVLAIDEKTFYVTNIYHYRKDKSAFMHTFEIFTKRSWTDLLLCSKTNEWQCSIVNLLIILKKTLLNFFDIFRLLIPLLWRMVLQLQSISKLFI